MITEESFGHVPRLIGLFPASDPGVKERGSAADPCSALPCSAGALISWGRGARLAGADALYWDELLLLHLPSSASPLH